VVVVSNLLDPNHNEDYKAEVAEQYETLRENYYAGLKQSKYLPLAEARKRALHPNFTLHPVVKPTFLGTKVFDDYPLSRLIPKIDWNPFFALWDLRGKYPNRGYPKLFNDPKVGPEAKRVFDEAQKLLNQLCETKAIKARAMIAFYPANSEGEDIIVSHLKLILSLSFPHFDFIFIFFWV
jgi:5-methyltetrahydrofolate--homocysteine methyltransferase